MPRSPASTARSVDGRQLKVERSTSSGAKRGGGEGGGGRRLPPLVQQPVPEQPVHDEDVRPAAGQHPLLAVGSHPAELGFDLRAAPATFEASAASTILWNPSRRRGLARSRRDRRRARGLGLPPGAEFLTVQRDSAMWIW